MSKKNNPSRKRMRELKMTEEEIKAVMKRRGKIKEGGK